MTSSSAKRPGVEALVDDEMLELVGAAHVRCQQKRHSLLRPLTAAPVLVLVHQGLAGLLLPEETSLICIVDAVRTVILQKLNQNGRLLTCFDPK